MDVNDIKSGGLHLDDPIAPRPPGNDVPLTAIQLFYWNTVIGSQNVSSVRNCAVAVRIDGPLDPMLLEDSIEELIRRHEPLRTTFHVVNGCQVQHVNASSRHPLEIEDLSSDGNRFEIDTVARATERFCKEPVQLAIGPLFSAKLLRLSAREHVLLFAQEHLITDGMSKRLLVKETWELYLQAMNGEAMSLPKPRLQFCDYAWWQHRTHAARLREHGEYWTARLRDSPVIRLPADTETSSVAEPTSAIAEFSMGKHVSSGLLEVARRSQTLLSLTVLSVYLIVMSRWCDQEDLVVRFIANGRDRPELEQVVGFLAKVLYVRVRLSQDDRLSDVLRRTHSEYLAACLHQDIEPVPDLVSKVETELTFNWYPASYLGEWLRDRSAQRCETTIDPLRLPLRWQARFSPLFSESPNGISTTVLYGPHLFSSSTVERLGRNLTYVAQRFTEDPDAQLNSLSLEPL